MGRTRRTRNDAYWLFGIVVVFLVLFIGTQQTIFTGVTDLSCSPSSANTLTCTIRGSGGENIGDPRSFSDKPLRFAIASSNTIWANNFNAVIQPLITDPLAVKFFATNAFCQQQGESARYSTNDLGNVCATTDNGCSQEGPIASQWKSIGVSKHIYSMACAGSATYGRGTHIYELPVRPIIEPHFNNQLMIVTGTIREDIPQGNQKSFTTYGFCDLSSGGCEVVEPKDTSGLRSDVDLKGSINSITVYLKYDGFREGDQCAYLSCTQTTQQPSNSSTTIQQPFEEQKPTVGPGQASSPVESPVTVNKSSTNENAGPSKSSPDYFFIISLVLGISFVIAIVVGLVRRK